MCAATVFSHLYAYYLYGSLLPVAFPLKCNINIIITQLSCLCTLIITYNHFKPIECIFIGEDRGQ